MTGWFTYLLQSSVTLTMLYLVFAVFLRKDTFFAVNRYYLLGSLLFSVIFPLFRFNGLADATLTEYGFLLETVTITPANVEETVTGHLGLFQVLLIAYITGASIFLVRFVVQLSQLFLLIRKYGVTRSEGLRLVLIHREYSPFSFFNLIFINTRDYRPEQLREIIEHEKVHIRQRHTLDLFLLEILTILQWFNPFIWFYRRSVKGIHEFLADEGVLLAGTGISEYQHKLLNQALGIQLNDLANNFNHSLLKRRFIMMTKERSGYAARLKPLMALPVVILAVMLFSFPGSNAVVAQTTAKQAEVKADAASTGEKYNFEQVQVPPEFKGGQDALIKYIIANLKYPEEAKKNGITGKVFVEFIVDEKGKVREAKIKKSANPLFDEEALRVISSMPDWIPGKNEKDKPVKVVMVLPITFMLDDKKGEKK